ncbi:putative cytochrome P450 [Eremomyces bilateralis CBS 781.70]|uniref:Cytochrome P450 n=1 Tax=Eremomyces bilateralis CBS 781.70 TaxID=1392243 RepID=A0A6G1FXX8_9PEZI|nr:putative cytochrome P450 [Eremomyces bilateralis CBS 781.70]KAF1810526.1 putative cytochrome P450 [Eremomyces bilateralis CBS 781.70]
MDALPGLPDGLLARLALLATVALVSSCVWSYLRSPLRHVPGPFFARISDLWRVGSWWTGHAQLTLIQLHRRFGSAVRLGPNMISLSDSNLINVVYSSKTPWIKSDMYASNDVVVDGVVTSNLFNTTDQAWHTKMVKPLRNIGTVTKTLAFEPAVDETIEIFCSKLDQMASEGVVVPMEKWLLWFAYDCLHKLTFGYHRGYLETGSDVGNFIKDAYGGLIYFGLCVNMPLLDRFLMKNPLMKPFLGPPPFLWAFQQAYADVAERKRKHEAEGTSPGSSDFLDLFLGARDSFPDIVSNDDVVVNYLFVNLVAGSDNTGISLAAIVYHVYRNPRILEKLRNELEVEKVNGTLPASYRDTSRLPYLDAVVHEGLRIHPPIGLPLERVVPASGWQMPDGGPFIPAGTKVGMNSWVSNRDEKTFGPEDVDEFVPERWMPRNGESDEAWKGRLGRMKSLMLTFGFGTRICTGKSVAMMELYKVVGTLVGKYDMTFMTPEWKMENIWFVFPSGFDVKIQQRR